jgi:NAD(P)-dependent dehydrogenase (short-subunit alcohol dehydrogenase family)
MRGLRQVIEQEKLPVRVNAVAPSWTVTGVVPAKIMEQLGEPMQSPGDVARATALLMADRSRQGHLVHIGLGKYKEIDEAILLPAFASILGDTNMEDTTLQRMIDAMDGVFKDRV